MDRSARDEYERDLDRRGYRIVIRGHEWASTNYPNDDLFHHVPCGSAVFDPDRHDTVCEAKE